MTSTEHDEIVASLRDAEHRLLTLRDAIIGAEAESASARRKLAEAEEELARLYERCTRAEESIADYAALLEATWASSTWRIGKFVLRPFVLLKRLLGSR